MNNSCSDLVAVWSALTLRTMPLGWVMGSLMFAINYVTSSRFLPVFFKKFDLQVKANRAA